MNLLEDRLEANNVDSISSGLTISGFRKYQYDQILTFCDHLIEYISRLKNNSLVVVHKELVQKTNYIGIHNSDVSELKIIVKNSLAKDPNEEKLFLKLYIPTLINENFFFLNGISYVPGLYCVDYPIQTSEKLIKISGLMSNIYFQFKKNIAYFLGLHIPINYFLQLVFDIQNNSEEHNLYTEICARYSVPSSIFSEAEVIDYFNRTKFRINAKSKMDIIKFFESIFFDFYTYHLYKSCYDLETITLNSICKKICWDLINEVKKPHLSDLLYKRIIFSEMLFSPVFRKLVGIASQSAKNFVNEYIKLDLLAILKNFLKTCNKKNNNQGGLNGNYLYDTSNLYSSILQSKISMVMPGVENMPLELQAIHPSHFGRLCPITISSQDPAKMVSVILTTKLDKFGCFI